MASAILLLLGAASSPLTVVVEDFEQAEPRLGGMSVQPETTLNTSTSGPFKGRRCAVLRYVFRKVRGLQYVEVISPHRFEANLLKLSVAVFGDKSGESVRVRFVDKNGECHQFDLGRLDFKGWKVLSCDLRGPHGFWGGDGNGRMDYPVTFFSIVLDSDVEPMRGTVKFDHVVAEAEGRPEDFVEPEVEPARKYGYFWGLKEKPSARLVLRSGATEPCKIEVTARLLDRHRKEVGGPWRFEAEVSYGKPWGARLPLQIRKYGVYFVVVEIGSRRAERSLCWLSKPAPLWPEGPFGVCCHFGQGKHKIPDNFEIMRRMGAVWFRDELYWGAIERERGKFDFPQRYDLYMREAKRFGLKPLIIFDYGNPNYEGGLSPHTDEGRRAFCRYCLELLKRYGEICRHFEVWNEPNIGFWKPKPNVDDYTALLKAVYTAVKGADPEVAVVGVCTAGIDFRFIEEVLKRDGGRFMDIISVHPYLCPRPPEEADLRGLLLRLKSLLDKYGAGHLKVWITEFGYPTHKGPGGLPEDRSAAYTVRYFLQALSLPFVERLFYYDFQNDGLDPAYHEHNFGLVRFDLSPKVGYATYCTMARMLYKKRFTREVASGRNALCYEFSGEGGKVLAAWSPGEAGTLSLQVGSSEVKVTDLMGNTREVKTRDGLLTLAVGFEPIFIEGYEEAQVAEPLISLPEKVLCAPGETTAVPLRLHPSLGGARAEVAAPEGWEALVSDEGEIVLSPPPGVEFGEYPLIAQAVDERGEILASAGTTVEVAEPIRLSALPSEPGKVEVEARNLFGGPKRLSLKVEGGVRPLERALELPPGDSAKFEVEVRPEREEGFVTVPVVATVETPGRGPITAKAIGGLTPCYRVDKALLDAHLSEWAGLKPCLLRERHQLVELQEGSWQGHEDLSARFWTGWDERNFYLALEVVDDVHRQPFEPEEMWKGDSVQFALFVGGTHFEFGAALGPKGPMVFRWRPQPSVPKEVRAAIRRAQVRTFYEIAVPWRELGASPSEGLRFRFSLLLNENDGRGREGWLQWFSGIGFRKDPALFGPMALYGRDLPSG